jgi:2-keto-4-pentenoate hydratase
MTMASLTKDAAALIWRHWQQGTAMPALPEDARPASRHEGYAIQAEVRRLFGRDTTGWKIAATSKAGQAHIGVDGPIAGRIPGERTHTSGATIPLAGNRMRVAEPEFSFRVGRRIAPRSTPYSVGEALAAMDALIPAIEVPDSRFEDFAKAGGPQLIADCACARDFVLGSPALESWRDIDLAGHRVRGTVAGRVERDGIGANVLEDPRVALAWIVNELSGLGIALEPGEVVTTGTCMPPLEIAPGDHVVADFGILGRVEVRFA